jgi:hypothetical protein
MSMSEEIRAFCALIIENLDTLEPYGGRKVWKKRVSMLRKHITEGKTKPSPAEILQYIQNVGVEEKLTFLKQPHDHAYKPDYAQLINSVFSWFENYVPPGTRHPDWGATLSVGSVKTWVDQHGYNVYDTPKKQAAELVLVAYKRKYGKPLYKPEVRRSDPVVGAPPPRSG